MFHQASITKSYSGLLDGVEVTSAKYYSAKMDIAKAKTLLQSQELYDSLSADAANDSKTLAEYMETLLSEIMEFTSSKEVFDRDQLKESLNSILKKGKGEFCCVLGGKSTGKSLVLDELSSNDDLPLLCIDMRINKSLLHSFDNLIKAKTEAIEISNAKITTTTTAAIETKCDSIPIIGIFSSLFNLSFSRATVEQNQPSEPQHTIPPDNINFIYRCLMGLLADDDESSHWEALRKSFKGLISEGKAKTITLIIDEANIALNPERSDVSELMALFVYFTKQTNLVNVILVSSEHSFPFRMNNIRGFKIGDITKLIFVGEVPPNAMYTLLTEKWGISPKSAEILMSLYGGHVYQCQQGLKRFADTIGGSFVAHNTNDTSNIARCFKQCGDENREILRGILVQLSEEGFCPMPTSHDPLSELLNDNNVAGVVSRGCVVIGLNMEVWKDPDDEFGLIPMSQSMRMVIAKYLMSKKFNSI